jgi:hypothetical protein
MDYQAFVDRFSTSLQNDGFTVHPNSLEISATGLGLLATHPPVRDMPNKGNDMSLFVGLRRSEDLGPSNFENFVESFHQFVGTSARSYLSFVQPAVGRPTWNITFPILVTAAPRNEWISYAKEYKPSMKSRLGFEVDHPILVDLTSGNTFHRESPAGRFGWGHLADFANEFVAKHLRSVTGILS